jgi:hypothetical protein
MIAPADYRGDGGGRGEQQGNLNTAKFAGTDNVRHLRVIAALLRRPMRREHVDAEAGCSNGPDLIAELRRRGLEIPCSRIEAFDRDGLPCRPGVYHLTPRDRRLVHRWLRERGHG